jgi:hypothetical protein
MFNRMRTIRRIPVRADSTTDTGLFGATRLIEDGAYDTAGKFLGEIEEVLIDARSGCVRYVVLALGGFLGIGRRQITVPWSAFTLDADYRRCIVNLALMQLLTVAVLPAYPRLREVDLTASKENPYLRKQQAVSGITPPEHRSKSLGLQWPKN